MKLCFMHYFCVVIILFNTGLYKSAISTYSFEKLSFSFFVFSVVLCLFCILNFDIILIRLRNSYVNHYLSKCHQQFCSYFLKAICKNKTCAIKIHGLI